MLPSLPISNLVLITFYLRVISLYEWFSLLILWMLSSMNSTLELPYPYFKFCIKAETSSSFSIIFADFSYHSTKLFDYLLITSIWFTVPLCRIYFIAPILSRNYSEGAFIEKTLWLGTAEGYGNIAGIFLSIRAMDWICGERDRQLARARPTGPAPTMQI